MSLPFHDILHYCDGETMVNMMSVSSIARLVNHSDMVKNFAIRTSLIDGLDKLPSGYPGKFIKLFVKLRVDLGEGFDYAVRWASYNDRLDVLKHLVSLGANAPPFGP